MKSKTVPALAMAIACALPTFASAQDKPTAAPAAPAAAPAAAAEKLPPEVMAVVEGEKIMNTEVEIEMNKMLASRGMPPDAIPPEQKKMVTRMIVDNMVSERLLNRACKDTEVTDADFDAEYAKLKKAQGDTDAGVDKFAQARGLSLAQLKVELRKMMKQRKWMDAQLAGKAPEVSDAEAKEFYEKNPQYFKMPEQVRASHILFMVDQTAAPEKVTEALKKAEAAIKRAGKEEDFGKLAGELSEEPGAKERGGDLDFFPREGAMVEPFAAAAFALKKGEITKEPVRTQFGYHVIKVTDRKEGKTNTFDESKELIVKNLGMDRKRGAIDGVLADLRSKAKVTVNLPEPTAPPLPTEAPAAPAPAPKPKGKPVEAVTPPVSAPPVEAPKK
jgi:peptidyl-prolyl cis-trans isomerase C